MILSGFCFLFQVSGLKFQVQVKSKQGALFGFNLIFKAES
jgi:hypothetical protein